MLLPCKHIAHVSVELNDRIFKSEASYHPYWHVRKHPLYGQARSELLTSDITTDLSFWATAESATTLTESASSTLNRNGGHVVDVEELPIPKLMAIEFPTSERGRHAALQGLTLKIIDSVKNKPLLYKKTMVQLNHLLAGVNFGLGIADDSLHKEPYYVVPIAPPNLKPGK